MANGNRKAPTGGLVVGDDGADWYRIDDVERMEPFLMTVVSDTDLWMFVSSAGPLTAGRVGADQALLPYETDDRLHRAVGVTGPVTVLARTVDGERELWRPFGRDLAAGCTRSVAKRVVGNALLLEEHNAAWGLTWRTTWAPAPDHGWVRTSELVDDAGDGATVEVLDGLLDVMPAGVDALTEQIRSNLVDAYKRSETGRWGTAAVYMLQSLIIDRAEPGEALAATMLWSAGLPSPEIHLDERVVDAFLAGEQRSPVELLTGRRGCYLLRDTVTVPQGGSASWHLVADTGLGHADVVDRAAAAQEPGAIDRVAQDVARGDERLRGLLVDADGVQATGDPMADAHHVSNVLFNAMRGGVFPTAHDVPTGDLRRFLAARNRAVHERWAGADVLTEDLVAVDDLRSWADATGDPDLVRLVLEYLPLTFSRRHGDPSRPWNRFSIRVRDDDGSQLLAYEGNWRDIFQNWEALLRSYPAWFPHVVAKFVNASTVDGHNPYRISGDGIDWEVPDPDDPWSNIGYWGDHQIVYLLRLLEGWHATDPDGVTGWLERPVFTYADVPYRIADHAAMVEDPRDTITFDDDAAAAVDRRVAATGADGRLVVDAEGDLVRVSLAEKLLVPALAKLSAYVAGGGIWMNTQRPEWNDANNALAGWGLSMVTLYHLDRYLEVVGDLFAEGTGDTIALSLPVAAWLGDVAAALEAADPSAVADPARRRGLLDALGTAGTAHRTATATSFDPTTTTVETATVGELVARARAHLAASIAAAHRPDGLVHAYNLLSLAEGVAEVDHLPAMLEGQVAALSTTAVDAASAVDLVEAMYDSALHRADLDTFVLYPGDTPPSPLARNRVPDDLAGSQALRRLAEDGPPGIVEADADGDLHFGPDMANEAVLRAALGAADMDEDERAAVADVYEAVFEHHAFTGRSSGMFGYEGLGSVYWHMVAKLLLALDEQHQRALQEGADEELLARLRATYRRVRNGLGSRKDPATFGAIPVDCYSHSPAHAGAQQPGMTGQVKEEVLARLGELGLRLDAGRITAVPPLLPVDELYGADGTATCTICATPVTMTTADRDEVAVVRGDGSTAQWPGSALPEPESASVFARDGDVVGVTFRRRD